MNALGHAGGEDLMVSTGEKRVTSETAQVPQPVVGQVLAHHQADDACDGVIEQRVAVGCRTPDGT